MINNNNDITDGSDIYFYSKFWQEGCLINGASLFVDPQSNFEAESECIFLWSSFNYFVSFQSNVFLDADDQQNMGTI